MAKASRRTASTVLGVVVFLLGSAVLLYPEIDAYIAQKKADELIRDAVTKDVREAEVGTEGNGTVPAGSTDDPVYEYLSTYNEKVRDGQGGAINDPWGIGADVSGLESMGLEADVIGSISIPRLDETLPLLRNATTEHMKVGAAVISGTSAPLGGEGNNCVIAAHRSGWNGLRMFRDIEDLEPGDALTIETPWERLDYSVVETKIIDPSDATALRVQQGRDLVTLFTCHPYPYTYQRYLVICERVQSPSEEQQAPRGVARLISQATRPSKSPELAAERWVRVAGLLVMVAMASAGLVVLVGGLVGRRHRRVGLHARGLQDLAGKAGGRFHGGNGGSDVD